MAQSDIILNRLCDLQETNFEIVDVQVKEEEIVWHIKHKKDAFYICPKCDEKVFQCHDKKWIELKDVPLGNKKSRWMVRRVRILCTCSNNVRVEKLSFRSTHHELTKRFVDYVENVLCTKMFTVADVARLFELDYAWHKSIS